MTLSTHIPNVSVQPDAENADYENLQNLIDLENEDGSSVTSDPNVAAEPNTTGNQRVSSLRRDNSIQSFCF